LRFKFRFSPDYSRLFGNLPSIVYRGRQTTTRRVFGVMRADRPLTPIGKAGF